MINLIFVSFFPVVAVSRTDKEDDLESVLDRYDFPLTLFPQFRSLFANQVMFNVNSE